MAELLPLKVYLITLKEADLNFDCTTFCALPSFGAISIFSSSQVTTIGRPNISMQYFVFQS